MLIDQVLRAKGRNVTTVCADDTLQSVAKILDSGRIGAVVALDKNGEIVGVVSERDLVRVFAKSGESAVNSKVRDAMTRQVITAAPGETVEIGLERMTDRRVRHLPVVSGGHLSGLVSIGDLVKWKIAETEAEKSALKAYVSSG
ncbi:MAG: CBS domain-containing protein [Pseudomonadota bacterium]